MTYVIRLETERTERGGGGRSLALLMLFYAPSLLHLNTESQSRQMDEWRDNWTFLCPLLLH